jgi:hypothetical protein
MFETSPLFIFEPVARGYRLDVLATVVSAIRARSQRPVFVVTREDFACRELARKFEPSWGNVKFVASRLDLDGASAGVLGDEAAEALLDSAARVMSRKEPVDMVFLGADDYLSALAEQLPGRSETLRRARKFVFLYNSEDLVARQLSGSTTVRADREAIAAIEAMDATLLAFEDGLRGEYIGRHAVKVLPDPWHGHFARAQRRLARQSYGLPPDGLLVTAEIDLLLDTCDSSWAEVASKLAKLPVVRFALQGNVWALRDARLKELLASLGDRLIYAGPGNNPDRDIKLIAATDLLLSRMVGSRCAAQRNCPGAKTRASAARRVRAAALGARFDRDVRRMLVDSLDDLLAISAIGMEIMRGELDRLAQQRLLSAFGARLRAALRSTH